MNSDVSPRLKTVESYARTLGYHMTIKFEPEQAKRQPPSGCSVVDSERRETLEALYSREILVK